jgi:hypothetical protein
METIKWCRFFLLLTVSTVFLCGADDQGEESYSIADAIAAKITRSEVDSIESVYTRWSSSPWGGIPPEHDNHGMPIKMTWNGPAWYLDDLRDALKSFP